MALSGLATYGAHNLSGVPWGSVLDPLLFVIYSNAIDQDLLSRFLKFADD